MRKFYFIVLLFSFKTLTAQQFQPETFSRKARTLCVFLNKNHYAPIQWNDATSARLYERWMELLDDDKVYFIQQDIDVLQTYKTKLDDELTDSQWGFFDKSIQLYKKAVQRADSLQKLILSKPVDFSKPDLLHYPFDGYATSVADLQLRLQKLTKWRVLRYIASELDNNGTLQNNLTKLPADFAAREIKVRERIKRQQEVALKLMKASGNNFDAKKADDYLEAISWCYDPHSTYMNMEAKKDFTTQLSGFEFSTGMNLSESEDGSYKVDRLEPGGSAWRSGELHKGDVVLKIKKGQEADKELSEMNKDEIDELLKGTSDDKVELTVKTAAAVTKKVQLTKEKVTDDEGIVKSYVLHGGQNIGYIQLPGFYSRELDNLKDEDDLKFDGCANDVSKEIVKLKKDTIAGLILDLRFNGGGSMWEAMQLAGIFIDYGPVGSVKNSVGKVHFLKDPNRGTVYDGPLMVLINGGSASASEFTSAVLQDYNRALIVGSTTYGKGTAQVILPMDTTYNPDSKTQNDNFTDFVKVTENKFYRVDGSTTQWKGVVPDLALPDIYEDNDYRENSNASALLPDNSKKGIYQSLPALPIEILKSKSQQRINVDTTFGNIKKLVEWAKEIKKGRDVPLQWQAYTGFYQKGTMMYRTVREVENSKNAILSVSNNSFDKEKIKFSTASGKELNEAYIKKIASDHYIIEARQIMNDWISK